MGNNRNGLSGFGFDNRLQAIYDPFLRSVVVLEVGISRSRQVFRDTGEKGFG
jgi:hypothetical protein